MPMPDGRRTRDEHRREIMGRISANIAAGMDPDTAIDRASADYQNQLKREGEEKIALVKKFLGIKD